MATISESTGDEREQRIAELKQKMQQSAKRNQEAAAAKENDKSEAVAVAEAAPVAAEAQEEATPENTAPETTTTEVNTEQASAMSDDAAPVAESVPTPAVADVAPAQAAVEQVAEEEDDPQAAMTRREFLTYAWGASLGLLAVETGLLSYFFMYPRFRAGEFGGKFFLPTNEVPSLDAAPSPQTAGKFWLVNTDDEGPKALYMVCTHLGCLYKWQASNNRFECPCHGSKFSKAGFYIEGPAPRSLDRFDLVEENGQLVVDTGKKITGNPSSESPARAVIA